MGFEGERPFKPLDHKAWLYQQFWKWALRRAAPSLPDYKTAIVGYIECD
jgi:hypothetical protein